MKLQLSIYLSLLFTCTTIGIKAQEALAVHGNMQLHKNATVGIHTNLINEGTFNQNLGSVGFYSDTETLTISGSNIAAFHDLEIDVKNDLVLQTSVDLKNSMSFINGKIRTPRATNSIRFNYLENSFYAGENNQNYIDGYALTLGNDAFTFPIGDDDRLRPLLIPTQKISPYFKAAYFFENPNTPSIFNNPFDTNKIEKTISKVTQLEFWDFDGTEETMVTLTWDDVSDIPTLSPILSRLRVVGWDKTTDKWVDLGNTAISGDLNAGSIQSKSFIPNNYEVLTIGSDLRGVLTTDVNSGNLNFAITPNNDGKNDILVFDDLHLYNNNELIIYNRWGSLIYKKKNYNNTWNGVSKNSLTLAKNNKLPTGTYFYILRLNDNSKILKGWIYVTY